MEEEDKRRRGEQQPGGCCSPAPRADGGGPEEAAGKLQPADGCSSRGWQVLRRCAWYGRHDLLARRCEGFAGTCMVIVCPGTSGFTRGCSFDKPTVSWWKTLYSKGHDRTVPFEEALAARLSLIKPALFQVEECLKMRPPRISPGMADLVKKLKSNNIDVFLVSGGFRQMIKPVAFELGIPPENITANQLLFGTSGEYAGFDPAEPTSRSGGKAKAVQQIKQDHGYKTVVMIGDGATDLEARQPGGADLFICYAVFR